MKEIAVELLKDLCKNHGLENKEGYGESYSKEITIFKVSRDEQLMPLLYEKGFVFIGQGKKIGFIDGKRYENGPDTYLMITAPQPIECESCVMGEGSLIGIYISLDLERLRSVATKFNEFTNYNFLDKKIASSVVAEERTDEINELYLKILKVLSNELDSKMLISSLLDELYFRILQNKNGYILQQLCEQSSHFSRVNKVVDYLHNNYSEKVSIEEMALMAGMSGNNFHRLFKEAFNDTPIQYMKKIRLNRAREMILHKKMKAVDASDAVGYESPTQFSREFKRYFGVTPSRVGELGYKAF